MDNFEPVILREIIENEDYMRKVYPYLKKEYFSDSTERIIFSTVHEYIEKYNARPSKEAVLIAIAENSNMTEDEYKIIVTYFDGLEEIRPNQNIEWLVDKTEKFCQNKAVRNAIHKAIKVYEGKDDKVSVNAIPQILMDAVAVSFDSNIGHDYIEQAEERFDFYHQLVDRVPFDLDMFNTITNGGTPKKTLNVILAGCVHPKTKVIVRYKPRE